MDPFVDLHMHTTFSDGIKTPEELILFSKSRNVKVMSINDHDNVNGVINMLNLSIEGIRVLCGIELSSSYLDGSTIHIAGYFPRDTNFQELQQELTVLVNEKRIEKAKKIVENLKNAGVNITYEQVEERCKNCMPSRPRIGEVLVANHVVDSVSEAFDKYLNSKSPYYVAGGYMPIQDALDLIHRYKGIACLAHPWLYNNPQAVVEYFFEHGVDGMECFPPAHHQKDNSAWYYEFAKAHNLLVTSGSDYHGSKDPEVLPGNNIYREDEWQRVKSVFVKNNIYWAVCLTLSFLCLSKVNR